MNSLKIAVDYKNFNIKNLNTPEFSHLKLLLYWPLYGLFFMTLERGLKLDYTYVSSVFDSFIPFCEFFIIPYYFWFLFIIGMLIYSLLYNIDTFRKYMWYIIITYSVTLVIYILWPTAQNLRPSTFARDNLFTDIVEFLYGFDTNTNVCPSLHVIGSFAVFFAAWNDDYLSKPKFRICFLVVTILICISTVFLKQHSVIDIIFGVILSFLCYPIVYKKRRLSVSNISTNQA